MGLGKIKSILRFLPQVNPPHGPKTGRVTLRSYQGLVPARAMPLCTEEHTSGTWQGAGTHALLSELNKHKLLTLTDNLVYHLVPDLLALCDRTNSCDLQSL